MVADVDTALLIIRVLVVLLFVTMAYASRTGKCDHQIRTPCEECKSDARRRREKELWAAHEYWHKGVVAPGCEYCERNLRRDD